jgi:1,4-dihydroxy-2-naphthoate octaprenyltransferase
LWNIFFALLVSLALQIAVNYSNDYSDGIRGTDQQRVGPMRLVGSGAKPPTAVKRAAFIAFAVAAVFGLVLAASTTWWLLLVGVACFVAGWFYTGGSKPYGYLGFGELFVFVFFGVVATTGTTFVAIETISATSLIASVAVGCLACALLVVNNLRDIPGDTVSGKKTLAVRIGDRRTRWFYYLLLFATAAVMVILSLNFLGSLLGLLGLLLAIPAIRKIRQQAKGKDLIPVLGITGRTQIFTAILLSVGIIIS